MKPMIILARGQMDTENIQLLRENGICVVIAADPSKIRFVDPLPCASSRTQLEAAAIRLLKSLLQGSWNGCLYQSDIARMYIEQLRLSIELEPARLEAPRAKR